MSLLSSLLYIIVLYVLLFLGKFNPFCGDFTFQSDPCHGNGQCYGAGQCQCEPGFGPAAWNSTTSEPLCSRSVFRGSRLLTAEWGGTLNGWADMTGRGWSLCCSTFEGCDTAAKFHQGCDNKTTLTVAHNAGGDRNGGNPGNFTFGGFVRSPPKPAEACIRIVF